MSDYVKSRPAKVGEKLKTQHFHPGKVGFAAPEDASTADSCSFGNGACLRNRDKVQPTQFVRLRRTGGRDSGP